MIKQQWQQPGKSRPTSVEEVMGILLKNRGVGPAFLKCGIEELEKHLTIQGMDQGAELMAQHLFSNHKIVLVGDYDCDGVTSTAQMSLFLRDIGYKNYRVVFPLRQEGYGIPDRAVREHQDAKLLVAMDCGTMDVHAISTAHDQGTACIVIDHHEVPHEAPAQADVLINPKQPGCPSVFKEFCTAGLTLLFLIRLRRAVQGHFPAPNLGGKYLALATLGTIADVVPLVEGNRILASSGLNCMRRRNYAPIRQILEDAGLCGRTLTAGHVGYYVGPRINAAGRMADPHLAYELLMAEDLDEVKRLAQELSRLNAKRQQQEEFILQAVKQRYSEQDSGKRTLVMADPEWAPGVIGIVASRIQQVLHFGPTIVLSVDEGKGIARGSARSVPGFDMHTALGSCAEFLLRWGGHKMAAGMTLSLECLDGFARRFEEVACEYPPEVFVPKGKVDLELDLNLVSPNLLQALQQLEPHGMGNPTPTFAALKTRIGIPKAFGRDQSHLRLHMGNGTEAIYWRAAQRFRADGWKPEDQVDVVFHVEWDSYQGKPVLNIRDLGRLF